jgi:hypothetical protein
MSDYAICNVSADAGEEVTSKPTEYVSLKPLAEFIEKHLNDMKIEEYPEEDIPWESMDDDEFDDWEAFVEIEIENEFERSYDDLDEVLK